MEDLNQLLSSIQSKYRNDIQSADMDPYKWYELFVSEGEEGTHTIDNCNTFKDLYQLINRYLSLYKLEDIHVDIWADPLDPRAIKEISNF